jgi:hypothetical protein
VGEEGVKVKTKSKKGVNDTRDGNGNEGNGKE